MMNEVRLQSTDSNNATQAFADAVARLAESHGGRLIVPAGVWHTGPIELASGVELHLDDKAEIRFSRNFDDYPIRQTSFEGLDAFRCTSPIFGIRLRDVAITGGGTIDGGGDAWRPVKKYKRTEEEWRALVAGGGVLDERGEIWWPTAAALRGEAVLKSFAKSGRSPTLDDVRPIRDHLRPNMMQLIECDGVRIENVTLTNSPCWCLHPLMCTNARLRGVTILNPWWAQNGDGIDLESCRDCEIDSCTLDVGDDAICLKSGRDESGRRRGIACEDIEIRNCVVRHGHGGVVIGSEMSGGVRRVVVRDCQFDGTDIGLRFKTQRGRGGVVSDIDIAGVEMKNIRNDAIGLNMFYGGVDESAKPIDEGTPRFENIRIRRVNCESAGRAIEIRGLPEMPAELISIEDSTIRATRGATIVDASRLHCRNVTIDAADGPAWTMNRVRSLSMNEVNG